MTTTTTTETTEGKMQWAATPLEVAVEAAKAVGAELVFDEMAPMPADVLARALAYPRPTPRVGGGLKMQWAATAKRV